MRGQFGFVTATGRQIQNTIEAESLIWLSSGSLSHQILFHVNWFECCFFSETASGYRDRQLFFFF